MQPLVRSSHNCYRWISEQGGLWFGWLNNSSTTAMNVLTVGAGPHPGILWVLSVIIAGVVLNVSGPQPAWLPGLPMTLGAPWHRYAPWSTLEGGCPPGGVEQEHLWREWPEQAGWLRQVFKGTPRRGCTTLTRLIEHDRNPTPQHQTS